MSKTYYGGLTKKRRTERVGKHDAVSVGYTVFLDDKEVAVLARTYGDLQDPWQVEIPGRKPHEALSLDSAMADIARALRLGVYAEERFR